ncbi:hypothetical protein E3V36_04800 [Candidatus Marinimicrobia bacterium MT.SAG.2]|nr:hypothetical protein E3V36_04800 [Candidatus Marinimicrobia bacterium MT.SAG.2]
MFPEKSKRRYLEEREQDLNDLFEVSSRLSSLTNYESIIEQVLLSLMGRLMIQKSAFMLIAGEVELQLIKTKGLDDSLEGMTVKYSDLPESFSPVSDLNDFNPLKEFLIENNIEVLFPLIRKGSILGILGFGKRLLGKKYENEEINYVSSLLSLAASSIENALIVADVKRANKGLDRKNQELQTLFELGKELNSTLDLDVIVKQFGYALMGQLMVTKFLLYLKTDSSFELFHSKGFTQEHIEILSPYVDQITGLSEPLLVRNKKNELQNALRQANIAALIPLTIQGENRGTLCIEERKGNEPFSTDDLQFLHTMGGQAIISIENARLFKESLERQRLQEELNIAREIQQGLLTSDFNIGSEWKVHGKNVASLEVGGDYFDVIKLEDGRVALVIADVSGKGAGASLLMSNVQASLRALINIESDLGLLVRRINEILYENTTADKFVTFFVAVLDPISRKLTYCNAGHNPPLRFSETGEVTTLEEGGLIIGMMPGVEYETETIEIVKGDKIVMYTDGITEAEDKEEVEYGEKRLIDHIKRNLQLSPEELLGSIVDDVNNHAVDLSSQDDVTLLILET